MLSSQVYDSYGLACTPWCVIFVGAQNYDTEIRQCNAERRAQWNAMLCHRTGYDKHKTQTPATQIHWTREKQKTTREKKEQKNSKTKRRKQKERQEANPKKHRKRLRVPLFLHSAVPIHTIGRCSSYSSMTSVSIGIKSIRIPGMSLRCSFFFFFSNRDVSRQDFPVNTI